MQRTPWKFWLAPCRLPLWLTPTEILRLADNGFWIFWEKNPARAGRCQSRSVTLDLAKFCISGIRKMWSRNSVWILYSYFGLVMVFFASGKNFRPIWASPFVNEQNGGAAHLTASLIFLHPNMWPTEILVFLWLRRFWYPFGDFPTPFLPLLISVRPSVRPHNKHPSHPNPPIK